MNENEVVQLVLEKVIMPFQEKHYGYVGAEFEYLIIPENDETPLADIGSDFLKYLVDAKGFQCQLIGTDGRYVRVGKDGDDISFDFSYFLLEFSMKKEESLLLIRDRLIPLFQEAVKFYHKKNCLVGAFGTNPVHTHKAEYTQDTFYTSIRKFLTTYAGKSDLNQYLTNMASVQTHIDIPYDAVLDTYNLFNGLEFVGAILFGNSSDFTNQESGVVCKRDDYWEQCGMPNTGLYDIHFSCVRELASALTKEKIFMSASEDGIKVMQPVTLLDYFGRQSADPSEMKYFRSFKHVVLNSYHVLEVRSDCTQPFRDCMLPGAFHVGIAMNYKKASEALTMFLTDHKINKSNSELRYLAAHGIPFVDKDRLISFLSNLNDIAYEGLRKRNLGEEVLLERMRNRITALISPAVYAGLRYTENRDLKEVESEFESFDEQSLS